MQCTSCGASGEGKFCNECGSPLAPWGDGGSFWQEAAPSSAPAPGRPKRPVRWMLSGAAVLALLLVGTGVWLLTAPSGRVEADPSSQTPTPTTTVTATAESTTTSETSTTSRPSSSKSSSATRSDSPKTTLTNLRRDALNDIDRDGRWAVTLSAKYDGIVDEHQTSASGSHTFGLKDILALHSQLEDRHEDGGTIYLVTSRDLESTADGSYADTLWMTMLDPGGLASRDEALAWCESTFSLTGDDLLNVCYPRQLKSP